MRRMLLLMGADLRMVARDPLLRIMPFVPFLAAGALRFAVPLLAGLLAGATGFDLLAYAPLIRVSVTLFPGMFYGTVAGFLLLDDRDDGVSAYWGATPVRRSGYLASRLGLFSAAALAVGVACARLSGLGGSALAGDLAVSLLGAAQVPFFALFLGAFAANKVEGLSAIKALGGLDMAPFALLLGLPARAVGWPFPQYWAAELGAGVAMGRGLGLHPAASLAIGAALSAAWIAALWRRYARRVD